MQLSGKSAIVTGAGGGIGQAVAEAYGRAGASIIVNDISKEAAHETAMKVEAVGARAVVILGPVGDELVAQSLTEAAVSEFGHLDILVNTAGIVRDRMIHNMEFEELVDVLTVHLIGTWCNCRAALRHWRPLIKQEDAVLDPANARFRKIINVTSLSGLRGNAGQSNYAAAKAGIVGLTKTLAREAGPLRVNVNAIAPLARTAMTESNDYGLHLPPGPPREAFLKARLERSALRWIAEPDQVTGAFLFFASPASDYITGQVLNVDGGANI